MLLSLALMFLLGMLSGKIFEIMKLPRLLGMLITGILLGPYVFNLLDPVILDISKDLRLLALIIILTRAGLNLDIGELKAVGRPALLMGFVPACLEIIGIMILAPLIFGISLIEAAIMGSVVAAVSPAVIVPRMLGLIDKGYGIKKGIPQMVMASSSVDDVFVIILFASFVKLAGNGLISSVDFLAIPTSIILGLGAGVVVGLVLSTLFTKFHIRDSGKVLIILSFSFILVALEGVANGTIGFSGLLAVMALGATIKQKKKEVSIRLSLKFSKLWVAAELWLFVLVGATVNIGYAFEAGLLPLIIIGGAMIFRLAGVYLSLLKTPLNLKERLFAGFSYMPKATVQAAIGGIPLAMGLACGDIVLTVAVVAIIVTAPLGAILIDRTYDKFLTKDS